MEKPEPSIDPLESFPFHSVPVDEVYKLLETTFKGLNDAEASGRLNEYGPNRLTPPEKRGLLLKLWDQINNTIIFVLLIAAIVCGSLKEWAEFILIVLVVTINVIIGLVQEAKSEKATEALKAMLASTCTVVRDGNKKSISADDLVPGDIIFFSSGDRIPADARIVNCSTNLTIQEAMLTGESLPVSKNIEAVDAKAALGDRFCVVYSATLVISGQGFAVVTETGDNAQIGRINALVKGVEEKPTALQVQLEIFGRFITILTLFFGVIAFFLAWRRTGESVGHAFISAISIAVAMIPEGLPAIVTVTMALGVTAMAKRKAIVRVLPAVETLGSVSVICSDKTGTLTKNEMTAVGVRTSGAYYKVTGVGYEPIGTITNADDSPVNDTTLAQLKDLTLTGILANDGGLREENGQWSIIGDPTDAAPLVLARKMGHPDSAQLQITHPRVGVVPFESEHKWMATMNTTADKSGARILHLKGAPEKVFAMCRYQAQGNDFSAPPVPLDQNFWLKEVTALSNQGLRVLALARAYAPEGLDPDTHMSVAHFKTLGPFMTLLCLVAIMDPPRPEAIEAIKQCHTAGITVKMITGDHPATAKAIGAQLGIASKSGRAIIGSEIDAMSDEEFAKVVDDCNIYARVSPENKIRVVKALQSNGHITSMTGDGVNDAPALKAASIGVAMGITGTEVSKEASKIVLADDNFASIVSAVEEGRRVWDNLRKIMIFSLPTNLAQGLGVFFAYVLNMRNPPLTAIQVLYVNMITAVSVGIAFAFEPPEEGVMNRPPRKPTQSLIGKEIIWRSSWVAGVLIVLILGLFQWSLNDGHSLTRARTSAFTVLVVGSLAYAVTCRKMNNSTLNMGTFRGNIIFWYCMAIMGVLQLFIIHVPGLSGFLSCEVMEFKEWLRIVGFSICIYLLCELEKVSVKLVYDPYIKPFLSGVKRRLPSFLRSTTHSDSNISFIATSSSFAGIPLATQSRRNSRTIERRTSQRFDPQFLAERHGELRRQSSRTLDIGNPSNPVEEKMSDKVHLQVRGEIDTRPLTDGPN